MWSGVNNLHFKIRPVFTDKRISRSPGDNPLAQLLYLHAFLLPLCSKAKACHEPHSMFRGPPGTASYSPVSIPPGVSNASAQWTLHYAMEMHWAKVPQSRWNLSSYACWCSQKVKLLLLTVCVPWSFGAAFLLMCSFAAGVSHSNWGTRSLVFSNSPSIRIVLVTMPAHAYT